MAPKHTPDNFPYLLSQLIRDCGMGGNEHYYAYMGEQMLVHHRKNHDYCGGDDQGLGNFTYASGYAGISLPQVFLAEIAKKLRRIDTLLHHDGEPENESLQDSFGDLLNYIALKEAARRTFPAEF